ncbi:hypothetical protein HPP92_018299 [Vanilla planifolia]|uniref:F-box domain-containing protein n=1 Tax=Vanilla planifolia TaxID=51239 RepID=A0A835URE5_VANPL|nr:hypothetical protein HPP92_018299 [Vanilla planifolia]
MARIGHENNKVLEWLPQALLLDILSRLDIESLCSLAPVCRALNRLVSQVLSSVSILDLSGILALGKKGAAICQGITCIKGRKVLHGIKVGVGIVKIGRYLLGNHELGKDAPCGRMLHYVEMSRKGLRRRRPSKTLKEGQIVEDRGENKRWSGRFKKLMRLCTKIKLIYKSALNKVREAIGVTLSVLCSNLRLFAMHACKGFHRNDENSSSQFESLETLSDMSENGFANTESKTDIRRMETLFHSIISSLKSGRSSLLLDIVVGLLYPVISLQETSHKDLSTLAKAAFELLKWRVLPRPFLESAVSVILSSASDPNWRTRSASLSYLRTFMYRHTFLLSGTEKAQIWSSLEKLLVDNQVEVREHAAGVLASLMKGGDEELSSVFRNHAYTEAQSVLRKRKQRNSRNIQSIASVHGAVLALAASVLSIPHDMPSWLPDHVTLLARFITEPSPIKSTVTKAVAEFRRTHADTWSIQKDSFTEDQLEVLADTSSSSSYFA